MRGTRTLFGVACLVTVVAVVAPGCSLGAGSGTCLGTLDVPDCWSGQFDLHPDFFAAVPGTTLESPGSSAPSMQIRIQHGGDYESFSDGIIILIDDAGEIRGDPAQDGTPRPSLLGQPLVVGLQPNVVPPGVPVTPVSSPSIVHATLYLDYTCRTQDDGIYAMDAVSGVDPVSGECVRPDGGVPPLACAGSLDGGGGPSGTSADAGVLASAQGVSGTIGTSTITFTSLFDNNPDESNASLRLSEGSFNLYLADPRDICPGGLGPPPPCEGHLQGTFRFYFQRGRPAQPFP